MSTDAESGTNVLKAGLSEAFSEPISLPSSVSDLTVSSGATPPVPAPTTAASLEAGAPPAEGAVSEAESASWREEYDARVAEWRAQNAAARKKAEETREKYAAIRAEEERAAASTSKDVGRQPLPNDPHRPPQGQPASSPPFSVSVPASDHEHDKWEDIPSVASSFPSLPSQMNDGHVLTGEDGASRTTTNNENMPSSSVPDSGEEGPTEEKQKTSTAGVTGAAGGAAVARQQRPSVTPRILDAGLPWKTRAFALVSSLAINMFLPFVNGVMLGFGEIFARNVIAPWFGWKSVINPSGTRTLRPKAMSPAERQAVYRREEIRTRRDEL
ncbi:hypothetical protein FRB99_007269 [Tulasnella sp. 403]|nr:hypothetical protein FRB99_007269 [Tulasnella sp. 403]